MSLAKASIIYELEKILRKVRRGITNIREPLSRIGAEIIVSPSIVGAKIEEAILRSADRFAEKINSVQKSIEESLVMSSLYIGFLMTMTIIVATVILYVIGY
ncbi:hypothetical protein Smar_1059 [Staphylothermus marinus F1]|uniref:Uncharacterized protein n=1 Tax=Staphylothermus marinus (strain ATCC 43588 / DSM 3639 / JCM 9404 / F1) TaxID=399550 RepID=A3DNE7_STAMF|nr:hypothetical protein [Staphylothermus marinus]ABN70157.1 hypothetical protein Smar_1059 [Staphylothermus marinus F1]